MAGVPGQGTTFTCRDVCRVGDNIDRRRDDREDDPHGNLVFCLAVVQSDDAEGIGGVLFR